MTMTYGKLWNTFWTGSMYGRGAVRLVLMTYCISNADRADIVELNPKLLADVIGEDEDEVREAIEWLQSEDPDSRTKDEGGRRIRHVTGFAYYVINREQYTLAQNERDMLAAGRRSSRKYDAKARCEKAGKKWDEDKFLEYAMKKWPEDYEGIKEPHKPRGKGI